MYTQITRLARIAATSSLAGLFLLAGCPAKQAAEPAGSAAGSAQGDATQGAASGGQEGTMASDSGTADAAADGTARGSAASGAQSDTGAVASGESVTRLDGEGTLQGQRTLGDLQSLKVRITNGEVVVVPVAAGAQPEAVWSIKAAKGPKPAPIESLELEFKSSGSGLSVKDDYNGPLLAQHPHLKLTLYVPLDCAVDANLGNGSLSIECNGQLRADVGNGSLNLKGQAPAIDANVGNGNIKAELTLLLGQHRFKVGNGGVKLKLGSGSDVSYSASTSIGNIDLGGLAGTVERNMMNQRASGSLGSGTAQLEIKVGNGGVSLSS